MADSGVKPQPLQDVQRWTGKRNEGYGSKNRVPKPEEIYTVPRSLISCIVEIAPKIQETGAWWSLTGDLAENLMGIHVRPTEVEIVTDGPGLEKIWGALSRYDPTPMGVRERKLERQAQLDAKEYPIFERSKYTEFTLKGSKVSVHGDYQVKVGEWEWGDTFFFEPEFVNIGGIRVPLMPTALKSEFYITLGWLDRAKLISDAFTRAHSPNYQKPPEPRQ